MAVPAVPSGGQFLFDQRRYDRHREQVSAWSPVYVRSNGTWNLQQDIVICCDTTGTSRDFLIPVSCRIPQTAVAYSLKATVVPNGPVPYLTLWPTGSTQPLVSTLNSDGRIKANAALLAAGNNGSISAYSAGDSDLIVDVNGYFAPQDGLAFFPVAPCRAADTRTSNSVLKPGQTRTFAIRNSLCGLPPSAKAYSLNFTAVTETTLDYLSTWATGTVQPYVSTLNAGKGTVVANAAIVQAGTNGSIDVYSAGQTHLVIDVIGYFADPGPGGLYLYPSAPCRIADTRYPPSLFGGPSLTGGVPRAFPVLSSPCGVPAAAVAYSLNVTAVPHGTLGYLTLFPGGGSQPLVSTLNSFDGTIVSNAAIVAAGNGGLLGAFTSSTADVIFDLNGYFAP